MTISLNFNRSALFPAHEAVAMTYLLSTSRKTVVMAGNLSFTDRTPVFVDRGHTATNCKGRAVEGVVRMRACRVCTAVFCGFGGWLFVSLFRLFWVAFPSAAATDNASVNARATRRADVA